MTRLQDTQSALLDAQHLGLAELARIAGVRDFFDTMVVVENFPTVDGAAPDDSQRERLLVYNEDDVRATHALRTWMTSDAVLEVPLIGEL